MHSQLLGQAIVAASMAVRTAAEVPAAPVLADLGSPSTAPVHRRGRARVDKNRGKTSKYRAKLRAKHHH